MNNEKTELRTVDAIVEAEGILSEKNLERTLDADGKEIIKGSLSLKVSDINFITFNVYVGKYTKEGKESSAFPGIETVLNEYQSIADVGIENATRVRVSRGQLQPQTYISRRTNNPEIGVRYSSNFFNRIDPSHELEPKAEFTIEGYVNAIAPEVDQEGTETGRLKVTILVPTYAGIEPFVFIVPEDLADGFTGIYEPGMTGKFYGDLINNVIIKEEVVKMAIGKDKIKKRKEPTIERVLTGAENPYEEDTPLAFSADVIRKAMTDRELRIDEMKRKAANKDATAANPSLNKSTSGREMPKPKFTSAFTGAGVY